MIKFTTSFTYSLPLVLMQTLSLSLDVISKLFYDANLGKVETSVIRTSSIWPVGLFRMGSD